MHWTSYRARPENGNVQLVARTAKSMNTLTPTIQCRQTPPSTEQCWGEAKTSPLAVIWYFRRSTTCVAGMISCRYVSMSLLSAESQMGKNSASTHSNVYIRSSLKTKSRRFLCIIEVPFCGPVLVEFHRSGSSPLFVVLPRITLSNNLV